MTTLQEEIIELLKNKIGVADGEEFYAQDDCIGYGTCKIFEGKLLIKGGDGGLGRDQLVESVYRIL